MKKFFALVLIVVVMATMFAGCAEVVSEREITVYGEADYDSARVVRTYVGGKMGLNGYINRTQPAEYHVRCEEGYFHVGHDQGRDLVKDYDGETLKVVLIEKTYDNGSVRYELVRVEVPEI